MIAPFTLGRTPPPPGPQATREAATAPTPPFTDTTADDLACAVAVLADTADRAQRLASLYRTPEHRAWAERATRAHAAVLRLQADLEREEAPAG